MIDFSRGNSILHPIRTGRNRIYLRSRCPSSLSKAKLDLGSRRFATRAAQNRREHHVEASHRQFVVERRNRPGSQKLLAFPTEALNTILLVMRHCLA